MLTVFQDGYGPVGEYYHTGQYNGLPVSGFHGMRSALKLTCVERAADILATNPKVHDR
jgi:hypothetical protein